MTTTTELWERLDEDIKQRLLDKFRETEVVEGWWYTVYDDFKQRVEEDFGFGVDKMFFSGFCNQGDGASFRGSVADWDKFLDAIGHPELKEWAGPEGWNLFTVVYGRYCYSSSMDVSGEWSIPENPYDEETEVLQHDAWNLMVPTEARLLVFEDSARTFLRDLADELYKDLEKEYEYLISDETVADYICNVFRPQDLEAEVEELCA